MSGVLRFANGTPVANATVWSPARRLIRTDAEGRYRIDSLRPGETVLEIVCPTRIGTFVMPVLLKQSIVLRRGATLEFSPVLENQTCDPKPSRAAHVHWRGTYAQGMEESSFRPCPTDSIALEVRTYGHPIGRKVWVDWSRAPWRAPRVGELTMNAEHSEAMGFIEVSGVATGPRPSGHMGVSNYELLVDSVFAISPKGTCDK
ncbi:MAG TPA: carboxypeptidase-like regulatory domain-containing protein [Gemmatimonadaceae bacterium]|nr:carboxypeptidase-like regulatory domain-containing protein [Gemmatimonadaceae bacterium]